MQPAVNAFPHKPTGSWTYVVMDPGTRAAAVIDPVLDYDWRSGRTGTSRMLAVPRPVILAILTKEWWLSPDR